MSCHVTYHVTCHVTDHVTSYACDLPCDLCDVTLFMWSPYAADLEQAEGNYEKAKADLESTLAELGDL